MSPTNALRDALEQIAALQARWQAPTSSEDTADSNAKWAAVGSEAHGIAVEALAAVPAEPEVTLIKCTGPEHATAERGGAYRLGPCTRGQVYLSRLSKRTAKDGSPIYDRRGCWVPCPRCDGENHIAVVRPAEPEAWEWRTAADDQPITEGLADDCLAANIALKRRRVGPWELVDHEPLTFPPLDEGPLAHLLDGPVKPDPRGP